MTVDPIDDQDRRVKSWRRFRPNGENWPKWIAGILVGAIGLMLTIGESATCNWYQSSAAAKIEQAQNEKEHQAIRKEIVNSVSSVKEDIGEMRKQMDDLLKPLVEEATRGNRRRRR